VLNGRSPSHNHNHNPQTNPTSILMPGPACNVVDCLLVAGAGMAWPAGRRLITTRPGQLSPSAEPEDDGMGGFCASLLPPSECSLLPCCPAGLLSTERRHNPASHVRSLILPCPDLPALPTLPWLALPCCCVLWWFDGDVYINLRGETGVQPSVSIPSSPSRHTTYE